MKRRTSLIDSLKKVCDGDTGRVRYPRLILVFGSLTEALVAGRFRAYGRGIKTLCNVRTKYGLTKHRLFLFVALVFARHVMAMLCGGQTKHSSGRGRDAH